MVSASALAPWPPPTRLQELPAWAKRPSESDESPKDKMQEQPPPVKAAARLNDAIWSEMNVDRLPVERRRIEVAQPTELEPSDESTIVSPPPDAVARAAGLPPRPYHELPESHYMLSGLRFSSLPAKHRPDMALPPKRSLRPQRTAGMMGHSRSKSDARRRQGAGWRTSHCCGDYCRTEVRCPASLQDMENCEHPWVAEAKSLCQRHLQSFPSQPLLLPEEMATGVESLIADGMLASSSSPVRHPSRGGNTGSGQMLLHLSWILEARAHPALCAWLERDQGWMFSTADDALVAEAWRRINEDDSSDRPKDWLQQAGVKGLRYKLQDALVCRSCWCAYNVIHRAITYCHKRARAKLQLKGGKAEESSGDSHSSSVQVPYVNPQPPRPSGKTSRSLILDPNLEAWLHNPLFEERAASVGRIAVQRGTGDRLPPQPTITRRCSSQRSCVSTATAR